MERAELWLAAGGGDYLNKPRPVLILQADRFSATESITVCLLTSSVGLSAAFRIVIDANESNGLETQSAVMADKIVTVKRLRLSKRIGRLHSSDMARVEAGIARFLGLTLERG